MVDCFGLQGTIYNTEAPLSRPRKNEEWERDCFGLQGTIYNTEAPLSRPRKNEERERDCFGLQATFITLKHFWADLAKTEIGRDRSYLSAPGDKNFNLLVPSTTIAAIISTESLVTVHIAGTSNYSYATLNCRSDYNPRCLRRGALIKNDVEVWNDI